MKTIGERIKQAREAKGWSGEELAKKVGYATQSGISNLEGRATGTGGNKIVAIARELCVPLTWLMHGPDSDTVPFIVEAAAPSAPTPLAVQEPRRPYGWPFQSVTSQQYDLLTPEERAAIEQHIHLFIKARGDPEKQDAPAKYIASA